MYVYFGPEITLQDPGTSSPMLLRLATTTWRWVCSKITRYYHQEAFLFCVHISNKRVFLRSFLHSCVLCEFKKKHTMDEIFIIFWVALTLSTNICCGRRKRILITYCIHNKYSQHQRSVNSIGRCRLVVDLVTHRGIAVFNVPTLSTTRQTSAAGKHAGNIHTRGLSHCRPLRRCYWSASPSVAKSAVFPRNWASFRPVARGKNSSCGLRFFGLLFMHMSLYLG